jgi:hypothetical protein
MAQYLCFVPLKFDLPPWSRGDVHLAVSSLPGWNTLDRSLGDADASHFELRLEVEAESVESAVTRAEQLYPRYSAALSRYGPTIRDDLSAMPHQDYIEGKPPPNLWRSLR